MHTSGRKGAIVILVALLMVALLGFGALAVDISQMQAYKSELRRSADAAVLAATLELLQTSAPQRAQAEAVGQQLLSVNPAMGDTADATFEFGAYNGFTFYPYCVSAGCTSGNLDSAYAVRVTASGGGNFYLAQIFGEEQFSLSVSATAYLPVMNTRCVRPWVIPLDTLLAHFPNGLPTDSVLRRTPNTGTPKTFVLKRSSAEAPLPNDFFGAVNLPSYNPGGSSYNSTNGDINYEQNIPLGSICHRLNIGDVIQAKRGPVDIPTMNGLNLLCDNLHLGSCYNAGGQGGVALRLAITSDAPPSGCDTDAQYDQDLDPVTGKVLCFVVEDVYTFVIVSGENGGLLGVYAGNDSIGPVRGYFQRPILVQ